MILEAVSHFLPADILPLLTRTTAFNMRVTINAVEMVTRELQLKPTNDESALRLLRNLLRDQGTSFADLEEELVSRLSDGKLSFDDPGVASIMRTIAIQQLTIDQPKHSAYVAAKPVS